MRNKIIAGNWKMNKDLQESTELMSALKSRFPVLPQGIKVILCPPFTSLTLIKNMIDETPFELGAQNMYPEIEGAFTGEISPKMLISVGCTYVILGHSERRQYFAESNEFINKKALKALGEGLIPIICVGETLSEREKGVTNQVVSTQVKECLKNISLADVEKIIIAYEPVWAIGTGRNATPQQAQEVHKLIRSLLSQLYNEISSNKVVIQYGGSVKPDNAEDLLHQPDIDGALVGGACLKADSFAAIIQSAV